MKQLKISVVIPCHNRHALLAKALASVRAQRGAGEDFVTEVIIVDDASDRPLAPTLNAGDRLIRLDTNGGAAHARNVGCKTATGDYIAFLDSDDTWHADKLIRQLAIARASGEDEVTVVCSGYRTRRRSRSQFEAIIPAPVKGLAAFVSGIRFCPGSTALMARTVFDAVGPFDETLARLEDYDWYIRLAEIGGRVVIAAQPLADIEPNGSVNLGNVLQSAQRIRDKHLPRMARAGVHKRFLSFLDLVQAEANHVNGARVASAVNLVKSLVRVPRTKLQLIDDAAPSRAPADEAAA